MKFVIRYNQLKYFNKRKKEKFVMKNFYYSLKLLFFLIFMHFCNLYN